MSKVTRFEDLRCWQSARELVREVYDLTADGDLSRDFALRDQLRRAAISATTNIAEGFGRYHRGDFIRFLDIAKSSVLEVQSLLYVAEDQQYCAPETIAQIRRTAAINERSIRGLLHYLFHHGSDKVGEPPTTSGSAVFIYGHDVQSVDLSPAHIRHHAASDRDVAASGR